VTALDLLVLGEANPDLILIGNVTPAFGQAERLVEDAVLTVGGSGAITACAASRLGMRVAFCGVVGEDLFGRFVHEALIDHGVDVGGLVVDPTVSTGVTVVLSRAEDRASLTHVGAISHLRTELIPGPLLRAARHVHVSQFFMQEGLHQGIGELLDEVHEGGATTSIDPNWDPAERWDGGLVDLLARTDVFLPNAVEATRIAGQQDVEIAARWLARSGSLVVVKLGRDGSLAIRGGEVVRAGASRANARDATGAGDAFDAGFLATHLAGKPLNHALAVGNACGALSTRAVGGVLAQPTMAEVLSLLESESLG
jgi:sugar/nucleoside kinase (ribokinase family)